ncbi:GIY-YIG nuclease family protein [Rhodococcus wratislaviensis]|uniref:GIY-YIG nuclease family protein n=1 Tax=Rhodococcus wratislaviensis TaxID=44752 RepID=UPI00390890B4
MRVRPGGHLHKNNSLICEGSRALVPWIAHEEPWELEDRLIGSLDVPLNLDGNSRNSFYLQLKAARAAAKRRAEDLPVFPNPGVGGR